MKNTYELRFRVPYTDQEQTVYGFKLKTVYADSETDAKSKAPFNAFDIRVQQVPSPSERGH